MTSFGVPAGAHRPYQNVMCRPGAPASSVVGTSGAANQRVVVHHRKGLDLAAALERQRLSGLRAGQIDLAGQQVLHDRRRPR